MGEWGLRSVWPIAEGLNARGFFCLFLKVVSSLLWGETQSLFRSSGFHCHSNGPEVCFLPAPRLYAASLLRSGVWFPPAFQYLNSFPSHFHSVCFHCPLSLLHTHWHTPTRTHTEVHTHKRTLCFLLYFLPQGASLKSVTSSFNFQNQWVSFQKEGARGRKVSRAARSRSDAAGKRL